MTQPTRLLGLNKSPHDPRTLHLSNYLHHTKLPPVPAERTWSSAVKKRTILLNDTIGDCAVAGPLHIIQTWLANNGIEWNPTDDEAMTAYRAISGYNPADPSTDTGCNLLQVLRYWRNEGIGGNKCGAFVSVDVRNARQVAAAINLFGPQLGGFAMPKCAQGQSTFTTPAHLTGDNAPGTWGGHCMGIPDFTASSHGFDTWGEIISSDARWLATYGDECYAILDSSWTDGSKPAPNGFDLAALQADLAALG